MTIEENEGRYLHWTNRPQHIKDMAQELFNKLRVRSPNSWGLFNGNKKYYTCNLDDHKLIKKMVEDNPGQMIFNIIDIGAGDFSWIKAVSELVNDGSELFSNKDFNVFGLNAEGSPRVVEEGNVKLHYYGGFKSEDLVMELSNKGHNLNNDVDLIISNWSLRHMVDPLGTVLQAYELLKSNSGLLVVDDFRITYRNLDKSLVYSKARDVNSHHFFHLYSYLEADVLMCSSNTGGNSFKQFIIQKADEFYAKIPVSYTELPNSDASLDSSKRTDFSSLVKVQAFEVSSFCDSSTLKYSSYLGSEKLYNKLKNNKVFFDAEGLDMYKDPEVGFESGVGADVFKTYEYCGDIIVSDSELG